MSDLAAALGDAMGDGYVIERELTAGGMSRVFVAFDQALNRRVAVKVLSRELLAHLSTERFLREVQMLATLQHPNIVGVISTGTVAGVPYFVMPYIEGESLRRMMRRGGTLPVRDAVRILRDVARALAFAHERGIVHRDIKPDNVLLADGAAVVSDFGVAKAVDVAQRSATPISPSNTGGAGQPAITGLTAVGASVGTPAYMSPEQVAADPSIDHRADIYSFGVLAYELLVGGHPFDSQTPQGILVAHLTQTPPPVQTRRRDAPPMLAKLVMQCLEKDRERRPQTAREILDRLDAPLESGSSLASVLALAPMRRRTQWLAAGGAAALLALLALPWIRSRGALRAPESNAAIAIAAQTLLVMPFDNIGADSGSAYIAEGMSAELIGALARVGGVRVILHTPSITEQHRYGSDDALARALNATAVLAGTVRHHAAQVRVSARLVSVATGTALWASTFDRTVDDVFNVQDDIVRAIASALGRPDQPTTARTASNVTRGTSSADAYDLFLRARYQFQRRGVDALRRATTLATQAMAADPSFARAYALRAQVAAVLPLYASVGVNGDSLLMAGVADASRAIALDSLLAEGYSARATLLHASFRWPDAEGDYRHALALQPDDPAIHQWLGEHLLVRGRVSDGVSELREAARLDPLSPVIQASFALATAIGGNRAEGLRLARRAIDLDSTLFVTRLMLGSILLFDRQYPEAVVQLREADRLAPNRPTVQGMFGFALVRNGDTTAAHVLLDRLAANADPDAGVAVGHIALAFGDTARALRALERAVQRQAPQLTAESLAEPIFDALRSNARFVALQKALDAGVARAK